MQPYETVLSPAEVYIAHEGAAYPAIDATPGAAWVPLGVAGVKDQSTAGVKLKHNQTIKTHSGAGSTGPRKAIRTAEELLVSVVMEDLTLETYSKKLNNAGVTEVAAASGVAGYKSMGLSQGSTVKTWALLVRVPASAYGDDMNAQFELPKVIENGSAEVTFDKEGTAAGLAFQFLTLENPNAESDAERFGRVIEQTAPALA